MNLRYEKSRSKSHTWHAYSDGKVKTREEDASLKKLVHVHKSVFSKMFIAASFVIDAI